jgi:hypothetical protein
MSVKMGKTHSTPQGISFDLSVDTTGKGQWKRSTSPSIFTQEKKA